MSKTRCILSVLMFTWVSGAHAMFNWWGPQQAECVNGSCKVTYTGSKPETITIPNNCQKLTVFNRGSADLTLVSAGNSVVPQAFVTNNGSNNLDMSGVPVTKMMLLDRASGMIIVNVTQELSGQFNGSGFIFYLGNPNMSQFKTYSNKDNVKPYSQSHF